MSMVLITLWATFMDSNSLYSETYVGDYFTLNFSSWDENKLRKYNGDVVKHMGFVKAVKPVFSHLTNTLTPEPGFYESIGDAVVKHVTLGILKVPMINLSPCDYRFTDNLVKNYLYFQEIRKFKYLSPLPQIQYDVGDKVLIGAHRNYDDDFFSDILDIDLKRIGVYYVVEYNQNIVEVRSDKIIDVMKHGEYSEIRQLHSLSKNYEHIRNRRLSGFRHHDEENLTDYERMCNGFHESDWE